jgi:HicB family
MNLQPYVDGINRQLAVAAEAGGEEARALAERLLAPLDAAVRLTLQEALSAAADEITIELAPGSVEVRLRGRDPEFVVSLPPSPQGMREDADDPGPDGWAVPAVTPGSEGEGGEVARINLRMPDHLKSRIEAAATSEGLSVNSWLVRAAAAVLERTDPDRRRERRAPQGAQRFTGWTR